MTTNGHATGSRPRRSATPTWSRAPISTGASRRAPTGRSRSSPGTSAPCIAGPARWCGTWRSSGCRSATSRWTSTKAPRPTATGSGRESTGWCRGCERPTPMPRCGRGGSTSTPGSGLGGCCTRRPSTEPTPSSLLEREPDIAPEVAVDGIDEFLDNLPGAAYFAPSVTELKGDGTLAWHATDTGDRWRIRLEAERFSWARDPAADGRVGRRDRVRLGARPPADGLRPPQAGGR